MRPSRIAAIIIVGAAILRLALAALVPLFPDETYYWDWSRHLAAGYFDHPGGIAVLIRAGTLTLGTTALGVRAGMVLAGAVASWALVTMTRDLAVTDERDAGVATTAHSGFLGSPETRTALLASAIPVALVGFVIATPDAALLAAISLALVALTRALGASPRSRESLGWWIVAGIMLGLGFCSKYTSVLLPLGVFVALLTRASLRRRLAEPGPYVATIVALLVFTPTILWNAHHQWISFAFQLHHGLGTPRGSPISRELNLVGGQLGLITPILAILGIIVVARALRRDSDDRRYLLGVVATVVIAFFAISAIRKPVEPNWPAPALVAAIPLLALHPLTRRWRAWLIGGLALAALVSAVVVVDAAGHLLPLPTHRDPLSRAQGWSDLGNAVAHTRTALPAACSATWFAADRYQDASELAFHLPPRPRVFSLNRGSRPNQYDLWPRLASLAAPTDCVLFVVDFGTRGADIVEQVHADHASPIDTVDMRWGRDVIARRTIWLLQGIPAADEAAAFSPSDTVRTALDSLATGFASRAALFDSVVSVFHHGPVPNVVAATGSEPAVSNSDRRVAIAHRIEELHPLLARAGATTVLRDARYPDCTFVQIGNREAVAIGYVVAAARCALIQHPHDDRVWSERVSGPPAPPDTAGVQGRARPIWLVYAAR